MKKLKKTLSLLLALVMVLSVMSVGAFAAGDTFNATAGAPTITTEADLRAFAEAVNGGNTFEGKTVTLADNIDLNNAEWTPIGTADHPFSGVFDGNEKTISNFQLSGSVKNSPIALFGYIKGTANSFTSTTELDEFYNSSYVVTLPDETIFGCEVKNLTVSDVTANTTADGWTAAAVAYCVDATVKNVTVTKSTLTANEKVGGVVAFVPDNAAAYIDGCTTTDSVTVTASTGNHAAGILARVNNNYSRVIISNCTNGATISCDGVNGAGIAGQSKNTLFYNCTNNGTVTGAKRSAGITTDSAGSVIINCSNTGSITSSNAGTAWEDSTAGIYAYGASTGNNVVVNCTNNGSVTANCTDKAVVSGIFGGAAQENDIILGCVNTGTLTNTAVGGKVYTISTLNGVPTEVAPANLAALNTALATVDKNVQVTSSLVLTNNDCTITPTAQEILTFVNSPAYLTIDLSNVTTSSLQVNVSNATISVVGSYDKSDLTLSIIGSGNTITYAEGNNLSLKQLTVRDDSGSSTVTVSAGLTRLTLAGTGEVTATVSEGVTVDQVSFATAGGTYTLNNHGTISHTQSDSNQYANEHTVCAVVNCTVTVNNYGTIEALKNNAGVSSYAVLLYCTTATVNQHPGSTITARNDYFKIIYGQGTDGTTTDYRETTEVPYVGYVKSLGANVGNTIYLNVKMVFTAPQDGMRLKYQIGNLAPTYFSLPTPDSSNVYLFQIPVIAKYFGVQGTISLVDATDKTVYDISKGESGTHVTSVQYSVYDYLDLLEASNVRDTWLDLSTAIRNLGNMTAKHWEDNHNASMANQPWIPYPAN